MKAKRELQDIDQEEAIHKYQHSIGKVLEKFDIYNDIEVLAHVTLIESNESENFSLLCLFCLNPFFSKSCNFVFSIFNS